MKSDWRSNVRVISAFVFAVALGVLMWLLYEGWATRMLQRALQSMYTSADADVGPDGILDSFRDLLDQNEDTIGWLKIDGTNIDSVVVQAPDETSKYLGRDFYGHESRYGTLFVAERCNVQTSDNIIIYGHHMRDGSMFGSLAQYESAEFGKAHPTVQFDTIYGHGTYEVVAVVRTDVSVGSSAFPYYQCTQSTDPDTMAEYAAFLMENRIYDTGRSIREGDRLLTLSTCNYHTANGRLIVVCRRTA